MPVQPPQHVVVIGAGMAGLAAAEALAPVTGAPHPRITILEATGRPGGVLETVRHAGWLVERSADNFLATRPEALALVERLGLAAELVGVEPRVRRALVWHAGRTLPAPAGFRLVAPGSVAGILATRLLSPAGKLRVLCERFVPPRRPATEGDDESLERFVVRRLGREAFERLVQPLAAGIWTADPARLGMDAALPEFVAMERECGSLWAGERRRLAGSAAPAAAGARYGQFLTLTGGIEMLPRRLAEVLGGRGVRFVAGAATGLARLAPAEWEVTVRPAGGGVAERLSADAVVVAVPAPAAARLLADIDPGLAADLAAIEYAGSAVVSLGFRRGDVAHPLDAAGLVVPRSAGRRVLAVSFSSAKYPGRAPEGHVLLRSFVGGALDPGVLDLDDAALESLACRETAALLGIGGRPVFARIDRWKGAMPQYHVGHAARIAAIERAVAVHPGLALAGAAYRGVGIPQVIASGQAAARRLCSG
jgi:oxygen-dependent protoporphyrinogen oxidase